MNGLSYFLKRDDRGQAIVLISLVLLVLFMFVGLAVDAGQLYSARRTMQEAADSAAYAGAVVVYQNGTHANSGSCPTSVSTSTEAYLAAVTDATKNNFTDGVGGATVTINNPPTSGPYCGNGLYVEVIIQANVRTTLVPAESGLTTVRVRGVAGAEPLNNGYALMAIDRGNTPSAFYVDQQADIHITGGGILVNSGSSTAAVNDQDDNARFQIGSPYGVDIVGDDLGSNWPTCSGSPCFPVDDTIAQIPDPFAGVPKPSISGLPTCNNLNACQDLAGRQLPGIYTVAINISGQNTVWLNPGTYILEAGISESGQAAIKSVDDPAICALTSATGCGVFLFNTKANYPNSGAGDSCGSMALSGNADAILYATANDFLADGITKNPYKNFLVYQDKTCSEPFKIAGSGQATFIGTGTIYVPAGQFRADGNNVTLDGSQVVAKTIFLNGGNININFNGGNTAQPILPRLSE